MLCACPYMHTAYTQNAEGLNPLDGPTQRAAALRGLNSAAWYRYL